jgi:hypothetical protein
MNVIAAPDFIATHYFRDNIFEDCELDSFTYVPFPPSAWANPTDCGNFPCSAPLNVLFRFNNNYYRGSTDGTSLGPDF